MGRRTRLGNLAWDAVRARAGGPKAIAARRERRLAQLLAQARRIPLYRRHWSGIPESAGLAALPPITKAEWVEAFEESVVTPEVTRAAVWDYVQNPSRVGQPWLGQYTVCRSSGVSGRKSLFLADQYAMDVCWTLWLTRGWLSWLGMGGVARLARRGGRVASLIATNGHFASATMVRRPSPLGAIADVRSATLSILKPASRLARALDRWQPAALVGYPTMLEQLAIEQREGRLALDLALAVSVSEWIEPAARRRIEEAFGCPLRDSYATSEFLAVGFECPRGWLHVNADWVVLEPVDEDLRPVRPGDTSYTTLLTNLANRVQPVVRHDLEDRVTLRPGPCPCGSPLPAVRVEGRQNDALVFPGEGGRMVTVPPMGLIVTVGDVADIETGVQFVQTGSLELSIRIAFRPEAPAEEVWSEVERRLRSHLRSQGLAAVDVVRSPFPPGRDEQTGKLRRIWSEVPVPVM
ncbi:MAG TPA: phenylacetate--CoA ligase family protein [Gemmatimonadota bacterium]|nr:phenylacetate--CoA ligase family protein [Gemmatimonadota bacterium]